MEINEEENKQTLNRYSIFFSFSSGWKNSPEVVCLNSLNYYLPSRILGNSFLYLFITFPEWSAVFSDSSAGKVLLSCNCFLVTVVPAVVEYKSSTCEYAKGSWVMLLSDLLQIWFLLPKLCDFGLLLRFKTSLSMKQCMLPFSCNTSYYSLKKTISTNLQEILRCAIHCLFYGFQKKTDILKTWVLEKYFSPLIYNEPNAVHYIYICGI